MVDPTMRKVYVGRQCVATLRAADIESLELAPGLRWTPALQQRVSEIIEAGKIRQAALRLLSKRAYSRGELTERLTRKFNNPTVVNRVMDELEADRWLDDDAYAHAVAESAIRVTAASSEFIEQKLVRRRIPADQARLIARQALSNQDPVRAATALAHKQVDKMKHVSAATAARRIAGLLNRRGFDEQTIESVINSLKLNFSDDQDMQ
jgi:regulatory protein